MLVRDVTPFWCTQASLNAHSLQTWGLQHPVLATLSCSAVIPKG
jgi:hypothetical protein